MGGCFRQSLGREISEVEKKGEDYLVFGMVI